MTSYFLCIDLKSFYASVECVERGLNSLTAKLVVADPDRSDKTICLAVSPALKKLGVKNRCRIFEIPKNIEYITAPPRMKLYIDYAAKIYSIYLEYVSKEDIHVYSIDEVFIDVTKYLRLYNISATEFGKKLLNEVFERTGIQATCGIGTNLYLAKVALDITAKNSPDFISFLNEELYCKNLWDHRPLTDFWRIGKGTAKRLESRYIYTMRQAAQADEEQLYKMFGIDAELLIDHAWGRESATIADIKAYTPKTNCITSGQVLMCDYGFKDGELIVKEMMDLLCLELREKNLMTKSVTLAVGYSNSLNLPAAKGSVSFEHHLNSPQEVIPSVVKLYRRIVKPEYKIRRVNITCNNVIKGDYEQVGFLYTQKEQEKNKKIQDTLINIKKQFGKNAVFKGIDLNKNATTLERNRQIGGHKSGE